MSDKFIYLSIQYLQNDPKMTSLLELWKDTLQTGYYVRKNKSDGLASWQPLKVKYSTNNTVYQLSDKIIGLINCCFKKGVDTMEYTDCSVVLLGESSIAIKNGSDIPHFFVQHFRIPFMAGGKEISFFKLMQIAYNAGQFRAASEESNAYDCHTKNFYSDNKLDNLETYVQIIV